MRKERKSAKSSKQEKETNLLRPFIRGGKLLDWVSKLANDTFSRVASRTEKPGMYNYTRVSNRGNVLNFIVFL